MFRIDLSYPASPHIRFTYGDYASAHTLAARLGLRVGRWFVETGETLDEGPVYSAEIEPLEHHESMVLGLVSFNLAEFTRLQRRAPTEEDLPWFEAAWDRSMYGRPDAPTELLLDFRLKNLFFATIPPPAGVVLESEPPARPAPAKAAPRPAPAAAPPAAPAPPAPAPTPAPTPPPAPAAPAPAAPPPPAATRRKVSAAGSAPTPTPPVQPALPAPVAPPAPASPAAPVAMGSTGALDSLLRQLFPVPASPDKIPTRAQLAFVSIVQPTEPSPRFVMASMRLYVREGAAAKAGEVSSWTQEVAVCHPADLDNTRRLGAYAEAWKQAVDAMIAAARPTPIWWVPFNLAGPQVLRQSAASSVADFRKAFQEKLAQGRLSL
jgi:hypothetical protein